MSLPTRTYWILILGFILHQTAPLDGFLTAKNIVKKSLEVTTEGAPNRDPETGPLDIEELTPKSSSFFDQKDSLDRDALITMDCHMRNLDFCYAGMLGSMSKALPETDQELEVRCDEMKATMSCMSVYNDRCSTFRVFSVISPFASYSQLTGGDTSNMVLNKYAGDPPVPGQVEQMLMNSQKVNESDPLKLTDLMALCEPEQKHTPANRHIRNRLFELGKCINAKIPLLRPCIEDLKVALQVFYEPNRSLPMKPSCCAISRFRQCSIKALGNVCGLSSFEQLEQSLTTSAGSMLKSIQRVCRQESYRFDSPFCQEILPPSGLKPPVQRRGNKASKLARALDLISFAPAAQ